MPWITLQGNSTKAITRFLSRLLGAVQEVSLEGVWWLEWTPVSSVFWNCSMAWKVEGRLSPLQIALCRQSHSKPFALKERLATFIPSITKFKNGFKLLLVHYQQSQVRELTFSSRNGPRKRRSRVLYVFAWTRCLSHRRTGCCNLETGQETHWMLCYGHRSLLVEKTTTRTVHINKPN